MMDGMYRIGIVGATSLAGKELADELEDSLLAASDFILLDDEEATGQVTSVGDEAAFVRRIEAESFERMDFVFFTGSAGETEKHWDAARAAGASIVDMTYALEARESVPVRAPWVDEALGAGAKRGGAAGGAELRREDLRTKDLRTLDLRTAAVVAAHPVAVMLGLIAGRLQRAKAIESMAATIFEPASEYGRAAMDELHQQTVNLLSFQTLPREQYDAQVAFNVLPSLGDAAKVDLAATERRIERHYGAIGRGMLPAVDLQLVQAPVFHGYVGSLLVEVQEATTKEEMERALVGEGIDVVSEESDPPSNLSAAGQEDIMVRVRSAGEAGTRFWIWMAADNLKLAALNAIACANELRRLRPRGKVQ